MYPAVIPTPERRHAMTYEKDYTIPEEIMEEICGAPRGAYLLAAESATGKVLTRHIPYRVLGLRW